jgi:hypothetical protein
VFFETDGLFVAHDPFLDAGPLARIVRPVRLEGLWGFRFHLAAWLWFNRFGFVLCYFPFQERFQFGFDFEDSILTAPMLHDFIFPAVLPLKVFAVLGAYLL